MIKSPYPYFGAKSKVNDVIWKALGDVPCYVEPFLGSATLWLNRPNPRNTQMESLNDLHSFICNFWRAMSHDPEGVAKYADYPSIESDLTARHWWLVNQDKDLQAKLEGDPDYYDIKIAGWYVWGIALWIGSGFCSGKGAWANVDGKLVKLSTLENEDQGVSRKRMHVVSQKGIKRQRLHSIDTGKGINRQRLHASGLQGIQRQLMSVRNTGEGINRLELQDTKNSRLQNLIDYFTELQNRFHNGVKVHCGDWSRVLKPSVCWGLNELNPVLTGVVLDPPYSLKERSSNLYASDEDGVDAEVRRWALDHGDNKHLRIAYCTYIDDDHSKFLEAKWTPYQWSTNGGYGSLGDNRAKANKHREIIYFNPSCLPIDDGTKSTQQTLF